LIKCFDSNWATFAEEEEDDDDTTATFLKVGTSKNRPTYHHVNKMMDDKGFTSKYTRSLTGMTT
jgi:hypothetical protein